MALELALDSMPGLPHSREPLMRLEVSRKRENVVAPSTRVRSRPASKDLLFASASTARAVFPFPFCIV